MSSIKSLIRDAVAKLRLKLVDLTNRNRLINFRFSDSSRKYIRVIDEVPDFCMHASRARMEGEGDCISLLFQSLQTKLLTRMSPEL